MEHRDISELDEEAQRLRVMWRKVHNFVASFGKILLDTQAKFACVDYGVDRYGVRWNFNAWLGFKAGLVEDQVFRLLDQFAKQMAAADREIIARAAAEKRAEKERLAEEVHARKLAKIKRDNELAAERVENAEYKTRKVKEEQRAKTEKARVETKRRRAEKAAAKGNAVTRAKAAWLDNPNVRRDDICRIADVDHAAATHARAALEEAGKLAPKPKKGEGCRPGQEELYEQYVIEGRKAAGYQWTLGDLAIKVCALKIYGGAILERYAHDIDVEHATLKKYRAVAKAWPEKVGRPTFSIGEALLSHPDRAAIAANDPHMTREEAREIMHAYRATSNVIPLR